MSQILFLIIAAIGLAAALGTVLARNLVHAALYLVAFFFIVACQFVLLEAEFLAAIQVLVYIGAVAILLMFGIMLTRNIQGDDTTSVTPVWSSPALVAGLVCSWCSASGSTTRSRRASHSPWSATRSGRRSTTTGSDRSSARAAAMNNMGKAAGDEMMTRYVVAFEVAGLLLTAALVGAIALAHREGGRRIRGDRRSRAKAAVGRRTTATGRGRRRREPAHRLARHPTHRDAHARPATLIDSTLTIDLGDESTP